MSARRGFAFVLHAHLPFVLNHGRWPHGADWLNEAAAETYLPLLTMLRNLERDSVRFRLTLGLTPVLCEQLASREFRAEFAEYLETKIAAARDNAAEFTRRGETELGALARGWEGYYQGIRELWLHQWGGNLLEGFKHFQRRGELEIITCGATHGYQPLLGRDAACHAQIRAGVAAHRRHFGVDPTGIWLPECAYRPRYAWTPPVGQRWGPRMRQGTDEILAAHGLKYFFVDTHMLRGGQAVGLYLSRFAHLRKLWDRHEREGGRPLDAERTPHRPYWVQSDPGGAEPVAAVIRDPDTGIVVWSGEHGYPGDGAYLDFHKKHFPGGLRYWRVTSPKADLGAKETYAPDRVEARLAENADHFVNLARGLLSGHPASEGGRPCLTAPFDAELFGHWWFEGVRWLELVLRRFAQAPDVETVTVAEALAQHPPEEVMALPEGSWGQGGFHWIWLNENTSWTWERVYEAEDRMEKMSGELVRRERLKIPGTERLRAVLQLAARELLLLEASDWQFLISTVSARDYAELRVNRHADDFGTIAEVATALLAGKHPSSEDDATLARLAARDFCFADADPAWWAEAPRR